MDQPPKSFELFAPTRVIFGESRLDEIGKYIDFADRILILSSERTRRSPGFARLEKALEKKHLAIYSAIASNPRTSDVNAAATLGKGESVQAVIGIGGGSVIDAAKGTAVALGSHEPIEVFLRENLPAPDSTFPIIAVPTTAGTGSEVSQGAILTDLERRIKKGIRGEYLLPRLALLDPELTYSMPPEVTAETGFDILTHAVETFVSKRANPVTDIFAKEAIRIVMKFLPMAFKNGGDRFARRNLMMGSLLMGYNLSHSSTCLPHRMQYPVGAHTETSHPRGLAALYRAWCDQTSEFVPERFATLAELTAGPTMEGLNDPDKAKLLGERIEDLLKSLNIYTRLRDLGISREQCKQLVLEIEGNLSLDPGDISPEAITSIYEKSW